MKTNSRNKRGDRDHIHTSIFAELPGNSDGAFQTTIRVGYSFLHLPFSHSLQAFSFFQSVCAEESDGDFHEKYELRFPLRSIQKFSSTSVASWCLVVNFSNEGRVDPTVLDGPAYDELKVGTVV